MATRPILRNSPSPGTINRTLFSNRQGAKANEPFFAHTPTHIAGAFNQFDENEHWQHGQPASKGTMTSAPSAEHQNRPATTEKASTSHRPKSSRQDDSAIDIEFDLADNQVPTVLEPTALTDAANNQQGFHEEEEDLQTMSPTKRSRYESIGTRPQPLDIQQIIKITEDAFIAERENIQACRNRLLHYVDDIFLRLLDKLEVVQDMRSDQLKQLIQEIQEAEDESANNRERLLRFLDLVDVSYRQLLLEKDRNE